MKRSYLAVLLLLAGCAAQQQVALMPRGEGHPNGSGSIDRVKNVLTVYLGGRVYQGTMHMTTAASSSVGLLGGVRTEHSTTNQASALLVGNDGQLRCDFGWNALMTAATGVCVDSRNVTYDMLIRQ